ncbi:ABC transporter ATP-binding protein [Pseudarthrobacter albicanus]|uniref:ABC transporter ATP-binding protein n=1 Tax=Pseudarthrobacter albicanus TaxID=2823873 RepID=UPI001BA4B6CF|nr:ABC transporter ATP-binding protein [Pseudarthrobacter albicanus]
MSPLLELNGLGKRFGQVTVAEALDLTVGAGDAVGIVGPNGAGKSSLFAMVSGDLKPDSGTVMFDGVDVTGAPAQQRCRAGIGRTYQIPRPFEKMTVFENTLVAATQGGGLHGQAAYDHAASVLELSGLAGSANARAGSLSLLQRKRLEVARGLATGPKLLLLDEVAGGLTEPEVLELVALIRDVRAGGVAVVWIEHVVHALVRTVDRLLCLAGGRFVADGTPDEVLKDPAVLELYFGVGPETGPLSEGAEEPDESLEPPAQTAAPLTDGGLRR